VTRGRFTKEEAEAYDLLSSIIFDSKVVKYTTIVRAGFPSFMDEKKCESDRQKLKEENPKFAHIFKEVRKIIYVDNPPMEGFYLEMAKQVRQESRKRLITYLGTCLDTYHPSNLATLNERIGDYMTNEEKLIKQMKELEEKRKEEAEKFLKEVEDLKKKQTEELNKMKEKADKDIHNVRVEGEENLRKTKNALEDSHRQDMNNLKQEHEKKINEVKSDYQREAQNLKSSFESQISGIQEQSRRDREASEKQINELREKKTSSASEITSALANLNLSNKSSDDEGKWTARIKELENINNNAQRAYEERMAGYKAQQIQLQQQASRQVQSYVEEGPGFMASVGVGAATGAAGGAVVGGVGAVPGAIVGGTVGVATWGLKKLGSLFGG